jgi:hypothetical protein
MKIKYTLSLLILVLFSFIGSAQNLKDINLRISRDKSNIRYIDVFAGNVVFSVSQKGTLRVHSLSNNRYNYDDAFAANDRLAGFDNTRIDYYDNFDAASAGKLKSVGTIIIKYYDRFDGFDNIGNVKSIGNIKLAYNDRFDGFDNRGKLKAIGDMRITYYDRFDAQELNGKLKSIGNTVIKYYDRFDGPEKMGKIKSVTGRTPHVTISGITDTGFTDRAEF